MKMYRVSSDGFFSGESAEVDPAVGTPDGWVNDKPPALKAGQFAQWSGRWAVTAVGPALDWASMIAARRYTAETAGITIQGMPIDTGRDSQGLITGAAVQAIIDPAYSLHWKTSAGFVELTGAQIIGVASAVRAYVQGCFDREAELLGAVADETITAAMLDEGWPA